MKLFKILMVFTFLFCLSGVSWGQTEAPDQPENQAEQPVTIQEEVTPKKAPSQAGPFAKGKKRVNIMGGVGSNYGETYLIIGGGMSYYVADGLAVGVSGEGWILQDPVFWKISPEARYTFWKMKSFKPYVGAFYRHTFMSNPYDDFDSWGGRAGISYRKGGKYVSLGVVHEIYMDCNSELWDCSSTYPEMSFWIAF